VADERKRLFLEALRGRIRRGHNFRPKTKIQKDSEITYKKLVRYVGFFINIDFFKNGVNIKEKCSFLP